MFTYVDKLCLSPDREYKRDEAVPTNNAISINFRLSSDAEIFVNKHRPSMQIGAEKCKNVYAASTYSD